MAADGGEADDFVRRLSAVFGRDLFGPMFQRATLAPGDVHQLIGEFRQKLDALDLVISTCGEPARRGAPPLAAAAETLSPAITDKDAYDDFGRNQRSRVRELILLEALARETRAYTLQQLLAALEAKGFGDTSGAIVSQLHRLKKLGVINQPGSGLYEITDEGLSHLRKLRSSIGSLIDEGR